MVLSISARSFILLEVSVCVYGGGEEEGVGAKVNKISIEDNVL